jgi:pimeloyl-ACP methyl ester carboxylesterase
MSHGLVIILPGIEGPSHFNRGIRSGLLTSGIYRALVIHSWGRPVPLAGPLLNQVDFIGNRLAGKQIADMIVAYQQNNPGRPVHVIGHSGGGGVAVFVAEGMPKGKKIDGLILLSASISSAYDLTKPLQHTRNGILNIYSKGDVGLLVIGTMLAGNVDGTRGPAAGAIGFDRPKHNPKPEKLEAYQKLYQMELSGDDTAFGSHTQSTHADFISQYVAPWILGETWPPVGADLKGMEN